MSTRNVLLITIDSLRADHTSCLDYERPVDPRLAELGESGTTFRQAAANGPNTTASFPSILTGAHSLTYGPYGVCGDGSPFLSRSLRDEDYLTVGYHSNPHLGEEQNYPTGFDVFNDAAEADDSVATIKDQVERRVDPDSFLYRLLRRSWHYFSMTTSNQAYARADTISRNAIEWLENVWSGGEFFMWLHYMDVHYPLDPPADAYSGLPFDPVDKRRTVELNGKMQERPEDLSDADVEDLLRLYDAEIRYTDEHIGRVLDALDATGALDDTVVAVTADHGEAFGEHGRFGHHPYPYEELVRVPLIISGPGVASGTIDRQVSLVDLPPTLLELADVDPPDAMEGRSFGPSLSGTDIDDRTAMTISDDATLYGCRTRRWKYITRWEDDENYLFDLTTDPTETDDVSADHTDVVERFESRVADYREHVDLERESSIERSPDVKDRLEDLGYVEE